MKYGGAAVLVACLAAVGVCRAEGEHRGRPEGGRHGPNHGGIVGARPDRAGPDGFLGKMLERPGAAERIGLSPETAAALKAELSALRAEHESLREVMDKAAMDQAKLISTTPIDEAAVMASVEALGRIRTEIAKLRIRQLLTVRKHLSPEQQASIRDAVRKRMTEKAGVEGGMRRRGSESVPGAMGDGFRERRDPWRQRRGGKEGAE